MVNRVILQKKAFLVKETPIMSIYVKTTVFCVRRTLNVFFLLFCLFLYVFIDFSDDFDKYPSINLHIKHLT